MQRIRIQVRGRVQGVGFRPFVYRIATELDLTGIVGNDVHGAFIDVEGTDGLIAEFMNRLRSDLPPLASISHLETTTLTPLGRTTFEIDTSSGTGTQDAEITPDVATCDDCRKELFDSNDRRSRYPFINCTNCGPRYSIIQAVPYDRPNTTMSKFTMCPACQAEYDDPSNRRFHAQPNACSACGPKVWITDRDGVALQEAGHDAIQLCAQRLRAGDIVSIKGIGGFHLACRAEDDEAVRRLRERKQRESKPLAMMVDSLETAGAIAHIDESAQELLISPHRPIVLVPKRADSRITISEPVAPGTDQFGIMLCYTPLHELLFAEGLGPLVMTSGNPSSEPLCSDNDEALERLSHIADSFLLHDRDIQRRVDDSVIMVTSGSTLIPIRRARGYAPSPVHVPVEAKESILAVGGEMKSSICIHAGSDAIVSEHLGELDNPAAYRNFVGTVEQFKRLLRVEPRILACDMHPDYAASRFARQYASEHDLRLVEVQHHHAHIVSVMAEHGLTEPVIGVACDGTGYGTDGAIWGCEIMVAGLDRFERIGHLAYFPLFGGDAAAKETWRPAAGLLHRAFGDEWRDRFEQLIRSDPERVSREAVELAAAKLQRSERLPPTSSLGRVFDAVAFILDVCDLNRHEAEAAMALEALAWETITGRAEETNSKDDELEYLTYRVEKREDGIIELDVRPMIGEIIEAQAAGRPPSAIAAAFHRTLARMLFDGIEGVAEQTGLGNVALSGGCFANRLLLSELLALLNKADLNFYLHREMPTTDGGIALGQAVVAAATVARE